MADLELEGSRLSARVGRLLGGSGGMTPTVISAWPSVIVSGVFQKLDDLLLTWLLCLKLAELKA